MSSSVFKQFEDQFGNEWKCNCGSNFESDSVEVVSKTKNTLLAKYSCQVCGREQIFAISADMEQDFIDIPLVDTHNQILSSDDVLDIRDEIKKIRISQIRSLVKKKSDITSTKPSRR